MKRETDRNETYAFMGTGRGCGTTLLSVAMANYLSGRSCGKTAHISFSGRNETESLREYEKERFFTVYGVTYFSADSDAELSGIFGRIHNDSYRNIVLDLGVPCESGLKELMRCNHGYLLGNLLPWNIDAQRSSVLSIKDQCCVMSTIMFLAFGGSKSDKLGFEKETGLSVISVPYVSDPLDIRKEDFSFFKKLT